MKFTRTTAAVAAVAATTAVVGGLVVANTSGDDTTDPIVAPAPDPIAPDPVVADPNAAGPIVIDPFPVDPFGLDPVVVDDPPSEELVAAVVEEEAADLTFSTDQPSPDEPAVADPVEPYGLRSLCLDVRHQPVPEQNAASGVWVSGSIYGLGNDVWIFVEGPTLNNGTGLEIPVRDGLFDAPIGVNQYDDHELERFEVHSGDPAVAPVDLMPTLAAGPGATFPVGPDEGPVFDQECFDFDVPAGWSGSDIIGPDGAAPPFDPEEQIAQQKEADRVLETEAAVDDFFVGFVTSHREGRTDQLLDTLHPAVPLAFGDEECTGYVERTTGSIVGVEVLSVGDFIDFELDTPNGPISFPDAIPFSVEFRLPDDSTLVNDGNLALHDGGVRWLTTCGN